MKYKLLLLFPLFYFLILLLQPTIEMAEDLGRQIKMGEVILKCQCIPQENLFSYTNTHFPAVNYYWLSSVIFYAFSSIFGINSLFLLKIVLYQAIFIVLFLSLSKKNSVFWFAVFMIVVVNIFSNRLVLRPEIFSFLFLSLFILIIEKFKQNRNYKLIYFLPLIQLLWVNTHVFFFIGPLVYLFFLIEQFMISRALINIKVISVFFFILLACVLNPQFLIGAVYPFLVLNSYGPQINENFSPFSSNSLFLADYSYYIWFFEFTIALFIVGILSNIKKLPIFLCLNTLFFMFLSFVMVRAFPLFALASIVPLSIMFSFIELKIISKDRQTAFLIKTLIIIGLSIIVTYNLSAFFMQKKISPHFIVDKLNGIDFVEKNGIKGPLFNSLGIGGYVIYKLYPAEKVYIDARPDAYPQNFMSSYQEHFTNPKFFQQQLVKYKFNTLIIAKDENYYWTHNLIAYLIKRGDWVVVYEDNFTSVLVKDNSVNKHIIERFRKAKKNE